MLVPLIHARSIIPKSNKHIWFRQHHILMYVRKCSKKQKYLIVKLLGTSSSDRSLYVFCYRCSGCINRWDVLINLPASKSVILDVDSTSSCRGGRCRHLYLEFAMWSLLWRLVWQLFNVPSPSMRPTKVTSKAKQHSKSS
jgi:hypothetical protein